MITDILKFATNTLRRGVCGALLVGVTANLSGQAYHNMSASDFSEDFAEIANNAVWASPTKTGGSWSGFVATGTATIPDATRTTTNSSVFVTGTSGGIQRGSAQTAPAQNLIFLSTGGDNTSATGLDLLLDFSGRLAGTLSFDVATVFNSTGNRQGTLSVYASPDGVVWTPVVGTNLPYVATNNVAGGGLSALLCLPV